MNRREFLKGVFAIGGAAALIRLGVPPREMEAIAGNVVTSFKKRASIPGGDVCVGWPSSGCVPTGTPATESSTTNADRTWTRAFTATGSGTGVSVQAYFTRWGPPAAAWAVLYRQNEGSGDSILIGKSAAITVDPSNSWEEFNLVAEAGQDLTFDADDVLYYGVALNVVTSTEGIGRNDETGTLYYSADGFSTSPLATIASWTSVSTRNMALIFKYQ